MKKLLFVGMGIFLVFLTACAEEEDVAEEEENRVISVETSEVEEGDLVVDRSMYGRAMPQQVTPVTVPAPGEITELEVQNGEYVEEGDRIATVATEQGTINLDAEASGKIANLSASEEEFVSNEEPLAVISNTEEMVIEFSVTANELERFTLDETYQLKKNDTEWEATVTMIDSMPGDEGMYAVEATVDNPDEEILTGMVLELLMPETVEEDSLIVPTEAVLTENSEDFVYVINDDQAEKRDVTVLHKGSQQAAIEGDVASGDEVVTSGQLTLTDGDTVETQEGE